MTIYGVGKLIAIEHVDKIQDKAHTQAQENFNPKARASKCRARAHKGPHKPRITAGTPFVLHLHDKQHCEARTPGARHWCVLTENMQWKRPGKGTWHVNAAVACLFQQSWPPEKCDPPELWKWP